MKLFRTKEEYDLAIENLRKAEGAKLPQPQYPKEFPAILVVDVKFHRMHQSFQAWVYLSQFKEVFLEMINKMDIQASEQISYYPSQRIMRGRKQALRECVTNLRQILNIQEKQCSTQQSE